MTNLLGFLHIIGSNVNNCRLGVHLGAKAIIGFLLPLVILRIVLSEYRNINIVHEFLRNRYFYNSKLYYRIGA